jgi:hypothetical protein
LNALREARVTAAAIALRAPKCRRLMAGRAQRIAQPLADLTVFSGPATIHVARIRDKCAKGFT